MRTSNTAALPRYSFQNGSSFSTLPFKILFHISGDGVESVSVLVDRVVDIGEKRRGNECGRWNVKSYLNSQIN